MAKNSFSRIEALAKELVEGSFRRLFGSELEPQDLARRIAAAMAASLRSGQLANRYVVAFHPNDYATVMARHPQLADDLAQMVMEIAWQADLTVVEVPMIAFEASMAVPPRRVRVRGEVVDLPDAYQTDAGLTQLLNGDSQAALAADIADQKAYLLVDNRQRFIIQDPVVTIGRRTDNDLVLDSAFVSRRHAQIRFRMGAFVLYDVANRNSTLVNGRVVTEHVLQSGDMISLSDRTLIFEQDGPRPSSPSPSQ